MKTGKIRVGISLVALVAAILLGVWPMTTRRVLADVEPVEGNTYCSCTDQWGRDGKRTAYGCLVWDCIWIME